MSAGRVKTITPQEAFKWIEQARREQRWIIPVFGSGVSVDTGFPVASHLIDYLVRFAWWRNTKGDDMPAAYLRAHLWPSRHDLHIRWWTRRTQPAPTTDLCMCRYFNDRLRHAEVGLRNRAMVHELRRRSPTAASTLRAVLQTSGPLDVASPDEALLKTGDRPDTSYTDYRALLNYLCDEDTTLIDAFFDHFSRNRPPSTTHQHLAFITRLLDCRLLMTTNFDPFAEQVLQHEGMNPSVYEMTIGGSIPSARLLHKQRLSIVKLHGGAYSLRTGFDLDDVPPPGELAEYAAYFRPPTEKPPLVVVMGYSGSDRRVMSILQTHLQNRWATDSDDQDLRLMWLTRLGYQRGHAVDGLARAADGQEDSRIGVCEYRDAGLFLHELYQNLEFQHPVTSSSYQLLTQTPRKPDDARPARADLGEEFVASMYPESGKNYEAAFRADMETKKAVVFISEKEGAGTSQQLARAASLMEKTHVTIWIDASEQRSRAALFTVIEEAFHRYDRHLLRMSRPLMYQDVDFLSRKLSPERSDWSNKVLATIHAWEETVALRWISMAMRRGRYVLVIDSLGEFTQGHDSLQELDKHKETQKALGYQFLHKLIHGGKDYRGEHVTYDLGESKVFLAVTQPDTKSVAASAAKTGPAWTDANEFFKSTPAFRADPTIKYCILTNPNMPTRCEEADKELTERIETSGNIDKQIEAVIVLIASLCRRPRSLACLTAVTLRVARHLTNADNESVYIGMDHRLRPALDQICAFAPTETTTTDGLNKIAERLWALCDDAGAGDADKAATDLSPRLLVRLEGGFFWMHRGVRQAAYELAKKYFDGRIDELFDCFADFAHADMHSRSKDAATFLEYFFFRLASINTIKWKPGQPVPRSMIDRCTWIVASLELERERLLSWGRLTALLNHIRTTLHWLEHRAPLDHTPNEFDALRVRLYGLYADIFLASGHPQVAVAYRYVQAWLLVNKMPRYDTWIIKAAPIINDLMTDVPSGLNNGFGTLIESIKGRLGELREKLNGPQKLVSMRRKLNDYRDLTDISINLAVALSEPTLYNKADFSGRFWEKKEPRKVRVAMLEELYGLALTHSDEIKNKLCEADPAMHATRANDLERWARVRIRRLEFELHGFGNARFDGNTTMRLDSKALKELKAFEDECDTVNTVIRAGPNSARRKRHKCYLSLMKARCNALRGAYHDANVNFERALASLPRAAGAAERTAEGLVHLFRAEAKQLQAISHLEAAQKYERKPVTAGRNESVSATAKRMAGDERRRAKALFDESANHLDLVPAVLSRTGRSENRWRVFLSYLKGRYFYHRSQLESDQSAKTENLLDALRHVVAGLTNTGLRSDRRHILGSLFKTIEEAVRRLATADAEDGGAGALWNRWTLQVGLDSRPDRIDVEIVDALESYRASKPAASKTPNTA